MNLAQDEMEKTLASMRVDKEDMQIKVGYGSQLGQRADSQSLSDSKNRLLEKRKAAAKLQEHAEESEGDEAM